MRSDVEKNGEKINQEMQLEVRTMTTLQNRSCSLCLVRTPREKYEHACLRFYIYD